MTQISCLFSHRVAVLGAAGTGKTRLATDLTSTWGAAPNLPSILIADNPSLLSAIADGSQRGFDHVLLMGMDLPAKDAIACDREVADCALRETLAGAGQPFTVIYGEGPARLASALDALRALIGAGRAPDRTDNRQTWIWACDTCSDPDCERRLLSGLLAARAS